MIVGIPMRPIARTTRIVVCLFALIAAARDAAAQARASTEVYGGYSFLLDPGNAVLAITARDNKYPLGWAAGVAHPISDWLAAVGEAAGHYKSRTSFNTDVSLSFHSFLGGARASARIGPLTEFVQLLAGAVNGRGSAFGIDVSTTAFAVQPGGGIDYPLTRRLAARLELDYRWIRSTAEGREHASQFRALAAIVVR